jgi:hypothetical protein
MALAMKKKLGREALLSDSDIEYLQRLISEAETFGVARLMVHHPGYRQLVGSPFALCREVIEHELCTKEGSHSPAHAGGISPGDAAAPG